MDNKKLADMSSLFGIMELRKYDEQTNSMMKLNG